MDVEEFGLHLDRAIEEGDPSLLDQLLDLLDENCDEGCDAQTCFDLIDRHTRHDLRTFIYNVIAEMIDQREVPDAAELLDGFWPYLGDDRWFDFLRLRTLIDADPEMTNDALSVLLDELQEDPDIDLSMEVLDTLAHEGDRDLFLKAVRQTLPQLETEEDFLELLEHCAEYYRGLDHEQEEEACEKIATTRKRDGAAPFIVSDPDAKRLCELIQSSVA